MVVISVSITQSTDQVVSGIPKVVSLSTNVPATIFYTLDGTDPTLFSTIYTSPIHLPFSQLSVTLKAMATDGTNFSPIVVSVFSTNILDNARLPHTNTSGQAQSNVPDNFPFGTPPIQPNNIFTNPAGITVDDPALPTIPQGFDDSGNPGSFTNQPFDLTNYSIQYSTTDAEGQRPIGVGNLPGSVKTKQETKPREETQQFSNMFDPRALVIFQDASLANPDDPVQINRQFFTFENVEKARDGAYLYSSGVDAPPVNGSFVRSAFNPRDNTITYYYLDSWSNRWIISKQPFQPSANAFDGNLTGPANAFGSSKVYEWIPHQRRVLF